MTACDRDGVAALHDLGDLGALVRDDGALERAVPLVELLVVLHAAVDVHLVQVTDGLDARARLVLEDVRRRGAVVDDVLRVERVLETDTVEVLPVAQDRLTLAMRRGELAVLPEHLLRAGVEAQVHRAATEVLAEVVVFLLALLPAGSDRRNFPFDAELLDRFPERGIETLRAEQNDGARVAGDHVGYLSGREP